MDKNDTFYTNEKYLKLKKKLNFEDGQLLIDVIGEAIQFGIAVLAKELKIAREEK